MPIIHTFDEEENDPNRFLKWRKIIGGMSASYDFAPG